MLGWPQTSDRNRDDSLSAPELFSFNGSGVSERRKVVGSVWFMHSGQSSPLPRDVVALTRNWSIFGYQIVTV
jgi:hypothetical protein